MLIAEFLNLDVNYPEFIPDTPVDFVVQKFLILVTDFKTLCYPTLTVFFKHLCPRLLLVLRLVTHLDSFLLAPIISGSLVPNLVHLRVNRETRNEMRLRSPQALAIRFFLF